jgi:site-specific DNA-methyltransferase (adenine-specific)
VERLLGPEEDRTGSGPRNIKGSSMLNLIHGDCLDRMKDIPDKSIDMILCDLPYGTTACKWDIIIPFIPLWEQYKRIIKDRGAIALFGSEPFSSHLRMSNIKQYKYDWIWDKKFASNFTLAKKQPLKIHEIISIFNSGFYFPQKIKRETPIKMGKNVMKEGSANLAKAKAEYNNKIYDEKYPESIYKLSNRSEGQARLHPTQKPVVLLEYLIRTYTLEWETVLDNCMGSGSTGVACFNTNRNFIGIEKNEEYFCIAKKRIEEL